MFQLPDLQQVEYTVLTNTNMVDQRNNVFKFIILALFSFMNLTALGFVFTFTQGNQYWRFDGDVLDEDYPRHISVGFDGIPDDVGATFAIPAPSHRGKEKAYFFKGICVWMCDIFQYLKAPCAQCRL